MLVVGNMAISASLSGYRGTPTEDSVLRALRNAEYRESHQDGS